MRVEHTICRAIVSSPDALLATGSAEVVLSGPLQQPRLALWGRRLSGPMPVLRHRPPRDGAQNLV